MQLDGIPENPDLGHSEILEAEHMSVSSIFQHLCKNPQVFDIRRFGKVQIE